MCTHSVSYKSYNYTRVHILCFKSFGAVRNTCNTNIALFIVLEKQCNMYLRSCSYK